MVAVGDDELLVAHLAADQSITSGSETRQSRLRTPYSSVTSMVGASVLCEQASISPVSLYSMKIWPKWARVERSRSSRSALGLAKVCSWRKTTLGGIVFDPAQGDEAAPLSLFAGAGNSETIANRRNGRLGILQENAVATPVAEKSGRAGIDICYGRYRAAFRFPRIKRTRL